MTKRRQMSRRPDGKYQYIPIQVETALHRRPPKIVRVKEIRGDKAVVVTKKIVSDEMVQVPVFVARLKPRGKTYSYNPPKKVVPEPEPTES